MEAYASTALSGLGYAYSQKQNPYNAALSKPLQGGDLPSMNNIYNSTHWNNVRKDEFEASTTLWNKSHNPLETGTISNQTDRASLTPAKPVETSKTNNLVDSLTGERVSVENFTHNNMQPFFRGNNGSKQNIDPFASAAYLEHSTGIRPFDTHKKETECFFEPTTNLGNVCGMKDNTNYYKDYLQKPRIRNNDFPIEQTMVGPGLDQGFESVPSGGYQQANTNQILRPKTVDELRPVSRPKTTYELPVQGPKTNRVQQRSSAVELEKHRPDTFHEQKPQQWFKTTGAYTKQAEAPVFVVKPTARVDSHVEYAGAKRSDAQPGLGISYDYGKENIIVYNNARDETQQRSILANLTSIVKSVTAPFLDILKPSTKAYTLDAARIFGNMNAQIPSKPTTYDPDTHIMRTTTKETTVGDTTIMNPRGKDKGWVETDDEAKRTIRETTEESKDELGNPVSSVYGPVAANDDEAKRTIRETTEESKDELGNPVSSVYGPVAVNVDEIARRTIRETTGKTKDEIGNPVAMVYKTVVINPEEIARRTIRETTEKTKSEVGNVKPRIYKTVVINPEQIAKRTVKETTVDNMNITGNANGQKYGAYSHVEVTVFDTQKQFTSDNEHTGISGAAYSARGGYTDANIEVFETQKQHLSDTPHTGIMGGGDQHMPRTIDAEYNAQIDGTREMMNIKAGYTPNPEGISQNMGASSVELEVKKLQSDQFNRRTEGNVNRIYQQGSEMLDACAITKDPQKAHSSQNTNNRLDTQLLSALKENPYNLSINPLG
jgi:hypothetical protein